MDRWPERAISTNERMLVSGASYGLGAAAADAITARGDLAYTASRTPPENLHADGSPRNSATSIRLRAA